MSLPGRRWQNGPSTAPAPMALSAATVDTRIRALAVDSVFDSPVEFLNVQVNRTGLAALPFLSRLCRFDFWLATFSFHNVPPLTTRLAQLRGVAKLFIVVRTRMDLAQSTLRLFASAPEPRQQLDQRESYAEMSDEERRHYEEDIVNFFLATMPPIRRETR